MPALLTIIILAWRIGEEELPRAEFTGEWDGYAR
jgi:hypothetical protein